MTLNKTLLALALGLAIAACSQGREPLPLPLDPATTAVSLAEERVRQNVEAVTGRPYASEVIRVSGGHEVVVIEDRVRNRLCYMPLYYAGYGDQPSGISCGPLRD